MRARHTVHVFSIVFPQRRRWRSHSFRFVGCLPRRAVVTLGSAAHRIVGILHSHSHELSPSFWDVMSMIDTKVPWVICKRVQSGVRFRGFVFEDGVVRRVQVTPSSPAGGSNALQIAKPAHRPRASGQPRPDPMRV